MLIRMINAAFGTNGTLYAAGQQYDLANSLALELIGRGSAVQVNNSADALQGTGTAGSKPPGVPGDGKHWKYRDEFKRADTVAPAVGGGWVAKGAYVSSYPLPAAADGKITGMGIECPGGLTTYWMRALPATPVTIKVRTAWLDLNNGQAGYQTFALICTNSAANLVDNMGLHLTLTHTTLSIQERILATGGGFTNLVPPIDIQPRLSLADGENEITVLLDPANNRGTVRLNEREYTFESQNLAANIGSTIAVELMQNGGPSTRWRGRILEVAADW